MCTSLRVKNYGAQSLEEGAHFREFYLLGALAGSHCEDWRKIHGASSSGRGKYSFLNMKSNPECPVLFNKGLL